MRNASASATVMHTAECISVPANEEMCAVRYSAVGVV